MKIWKRYAQYEKVEQIQKHLRKKQQHSQHLVLKELVKIGTYLIANIAVNRVSSSLKDLKKNKTINAFVME